MRRLYLSFLCLGLFTVCTGCVEERVVAHDLVRDSFFADQSGVRSPQIENGSFQGRVYQKFGFEMPTRRTGELYSSAQGPASRLRFVMGMPANLILRLRGRRVPEAGNVERVRVKINSKLITVLELEEQFKEHHFPISADLLQVGGNDLDLVYEPAPEIDYDTLTGVDWESFRFLPESGESRIVKEDERVSLIIPPGARLDYFYKLDQGSVLETGLLETVVHPGQAAESVTLEISVHGKDQAPWMRELEPGEKHDVALPDISGPVQISLLCRMNDNGENPTTSLRFSPRITRPVTSSVSAEESRPVDLPRKPNIVIVLIDTLRADHLGCYGYERDTTPEIDSFSQDAALFEKGRAPCSFTKTSVASLLTGQFPRTHGVLNFDTKLPPKGTLPQTLRDHGYLTAGVNSNDWLTKEFGFSEGYDYYTSKSGKRATEVVAEGLDWLDRQPQDKPFYLYLHLLEPHLAYRPEEPFRKIMAPHLSQEFGLETKEIIAKLKREGLEPREGLIQDFIDLYDGEILCADKSFGDLTDGLKERALYDSTMVVFLSDHGEEFFDHTWWEHGATLYEESVRVPMIVKFPNGYAAGTRVKGEANLVDIFPTLLDYLDIQVESLEGRSLLPVVANPEKHEDGIPRFASLVLSADESTDPLGDSYRVEVDSIIEDDIKLVRFREHYRSKYESIEMYDLGRDPGEKESLIDNTIDVGYRLFQLRAHLTEKVLRDVVDIETVKQRLESLQYL